MESDHMTFEPVNGDWRGNEAPFPERIRYTAIQDFAIGRGLYMDNDGSGETIVLRLFVANDRDELLSGHFALSGETAVGMFAALGLCLQDCGIDVPDVKTAHQQMREMATLAEMEKDVGSDSEGDDEDDGD